MSCGPDKPFTTDGCSGGMTWGWKKLFRRDPPWERCCVEHDHAYWKGGTKEDRRNADRALLRCVINNGHPFWGFLMYCAVRIGGHPYFSFKWRWGYGYTVKRGYDK